VGVVVLDVLAQDVGEGAGSGNENPVEAFAAQRADPAFGEGVGPWWDPDDLDVGGDEYRVERLR
jgi:hypothetical protein